MPNTEHKPTERVLNILELLGTTPSGLSLSDIAKQIGSPKTTVAPILHTMASRNFICIPQGQQPLHHRHRRLPGGQFLLW